MKEKAPNDWGFFILRRERDYATRALLPTVVGSNPRVLIQQFSLNKKSNHLVAFLFSGERGIRTLDKL